MSQTIFANELPRPTFRWLQVNHTEMTVLGGSESAVLTVTANDGVVTPLTTKDRLKEAYTGAEKGTLDTVVSAPTNALEIKVPAGKETVVLALDGKSTSLADRTHVRVVVGKGAALDLMYVLKGEGEGSVQLFTEILAEAEAHVQVKTVQLMGEGIQHIAHRYAKLEDKSEVEFINIELGGGDNILHFEEDLLGEQAKFSHRLAYLGHKKQRFDVSMLMTHAGKKTESDVHMLGALSGEAKKSFRGTLDFLRGSIAAVGSEEDTCLLLDPTVKSVSLPLLLCKEDNVVGNHAASAGQLDQSKLFYIMSRGFSEAEAKHMIVESMLRPIIDTIGDEALEEEALSCVRHKI